MRRLEIVLQRDEEGWEALRTIASRALAPEDGEERQWKWEGRAWGRRVYIPDQLGLCVTASTAFFAGD